MSFVVPVKEPPRMEYPLPAGPPVQQGVVGPGAHHQLPGVGGIGGNIPHLPPSQDDQARWSQYQHLWRQHVYINGNSKPSHGHGHSGSKELGGALDGPADDKTKEDSELWCNVEAQTAFLGPNLWDKTYETDLKYVDLDAFLSENGVSMDGSSMGAFAGANGGPHHTHPGATKRERSPSPSDCMSPDTLNPSSPADSSRDFDPRTRAFSDEELKPQPMIKKSRKQFVPDNLKDDKYWARRRKNNMAAKRSRDARRMKENQIALRAGYLEKENIGLRQELDRLKKENLLLRDKLSKCGDV